MAKFEPRRPRKLLLHKKQVSTLAGSIAREGITLVPLDIHFSDRGMAKVTLGLAEGKQAHDKRASIAARDWQRDKARIMRNKGGE
jgi:SsrA-binding protein